MYFNPQGKVGLHALSHVYCLKARTRQIIFQLNHSFKLQTQREGRGGLGPRGDDNKAPLSENDETRRGGNHRKKNTTDNMKKRRRRNRALQQQEQTLLKRSAAGLFI